MGRPRQPPTRYSVLAVCTANLCRSPVMQYLLAEALGPNSSIRSAGTDAVGGAPMHPLSLEVLADRGIDGSSFRSAPLRLDLIDRAHLILTAEGSHRKAVLAMRPNAASRTFTLFQFARLVDSSRAGGERYLGAAIARAHRERIGAVVDDDLADPIGRPRATFVEMADRVAAAAVTIAREAGASTARPGP